MRLPSSMNTFLMQNLLPFFPVTEEALSFYLARFVNEVKLRILLNYHLSILNMISFLGNFLVTVWSVKLHILDEKVRTKEQLGKIYQAKEILYDSAKSICYLPETHPAAIDLMNKSKSFRSFHSKIEKFVKCFEEEKAIKDFYENNQEEEQTIFNEFATAQLSRKSAQ